MPVRLSRREYNRRFGATTGDRIRLGDTNLFARVEADDNLYGSELYAGFARPMRDGMLFGRRPAGPSELDLLITNVVIIDSALGIRRTNIGIKDGRIAGIGRAGNPDVTDGIDLIVGSSTGLITGDGLIATAGAVDSHVHLSSPSMAVAALQGGVTSLIAQGSGGVWDMGVNPANNVAHVYEAFESIPINLAVLARGSTDLPQMQTAFEHGAAGLKIHEDTGAYTSVIDACLTVADQAGGQVCIHTDGVNEGGDLRDTIAAVNGRSIHFYHVEGSGGGHAPNLLEVCADPSIIGSSTNPTLPYSINSVAEQLDMIATVHRLDLALPEDYAAAQDRVRAGTIAGEDLLHDLGAIAIVSSDSQGMGRIGQVVSRTWQVAHRMKELRGGGFDRTTGAGDDNARILQYVAKYTINPALTHGLDQEVGTLEAGKLADIVLWHPAFFGAKPQVVIKGGFVALGQIGDGDGSTRVSQPQVFGPMWGGLGAAPAHLAVNFISDAAHASGGLHGGKHLVRRSVPIRNVRQTFKANMQRNTAAPSVTVDPATHMVTVDGVLVDHPPAEELPLTRRYFAY